MGIMMTGVIIEMDLTQGYQNKLKFNNAQLMFVLLLELELDLYL